MKKKFLFLFVISFTECIYAEKTITHQPMIWYAYFQNLKINDRFSIYSDIQERHFIGPARQSQFLIRSSFNTTIASNWDFGAGLCIALTNTDPTLNYELESPEIRPHIEFNNKQKFKHVAVWHRYRLESRFLHNTNGKDLIEGFSFNNMRFRYQLNVDFYLHKPAKDKNALNLRIFDEFMLNFGSKIKYNLFDQNRIYIMLQYAPIEDVKLEVGYANIFQQRVTGDKFFDRNALRIAIIHNISVKKKVKTTPGTGI